MTRWVWSLAGAIVAHVALYWCVGLVAEPPKQRQPAVDRPGPLLFAGRSRSAPTDVTAPMDAADEQLLLNDPRPLLLPTQWNFPSAERVGELVQEERTIFPEYPSVFQGGRGEFTSSFGNRWKAAESATELQLGFPHDPLEGLALGTPPTLEAQPDGIELVVRDPGSGEEVHREFAYKATAPEIESLGNNWTEAIFLGTVTETFLSPSLSLVQSSGQERIDEALAKLLAGGLGRGIVLPDGPYLLEIGP